ncbi:hypothetical protein EAE99_004472 [Botrytis elliptica]|nr:hypothetical protein EAE99_004472 [Botrytis elliptica]
MSEQSEHNIQVTEASQENGFFEEFDELFNKEYEKVEAAAAAAPSLASEPQAGAPLAENGQVDETSEVDGFYYDFEMDIEIAQEAAAPAVLAPEPQAENGQVDEDAEGNGFDAEFDADFNAEYDEAYEEEQRNAAADAVAPVAPVAPAPKRKANDALVKSLGIILTTAEMRARARVWQERREKAEREERERRIAGYQASGTSIDEAICLD